MLKLTRVAGLVTDRQTKQCRSPPPEIPGFPAPGSGQHQIRQALLDFVLTAGSMGQVSILVAPGGQWGPHAARRARALGYCTTEALCACSEGFFVVVVEV